MAKTLIDHIEEVLLEKNKIMHIKDIASRILELHAYPQDDLDSLTQKVGARLATHAKKRGSKFSRSKTKGKIKGYYRLKKSARKPSRQEVVPQPKLDTNTTGKAGEHAVLSELLFWGYNASIMTVDDGIDLIASKDNSYFYIQVKTANLSAGDKYTFNIKSAKFKEKHSGKTYYILVLRRMGQYHYANDFIVIPSQEIMRLLATNTIKNKVQLALNISIDNSGKYILNKEEDFTGRINDFRSII